MSEPKLKKGSQVPESNFITTIDHSNVHSTKDTGFWPVQQDCD